MRFLSSSLVMVFFAIPLFAQYSLTGTVEDASNGTKLPGANVVVEGTFKGVHSAADGSFEINGLDPGPYNLLVSFIGYETQRVSVEYPANEALQINLIPSAMLTQEVIVMATRADQRTPATRTDVSGEFIKANNLGQDIPYLLSLTPGLVTSSDAGTGIGYTWMNIRGSDNTRINVTVNGVPVNDAESHGVWWVNMPDVASSTENIQIQRGVGTSTQGAASFGATISIETTSLHENPYAEVISSAGSFGTLRNTVNFGTGILNDGWVFDGRLSKIDSEGYIDRSSADLTSYYLSGGYYGKNTAVKAITFSGRETTYQAWYGVPGHALDTNRTYNPAGIYFDEEGNKRYYDNETDNYQQDHYQLHLTHRFVPSLIGNTSLHYTHGRGYYEQYREDDDFASYGLPDFIIDQQVFEQTDLIRQRWLRNDFYGATWSLNYNDLGRLQGVLGGGFNVYDGDHFGEIIWAQLAQNFEKGYRYYDNNARKQDFNSFLKLNYELVPNLYVFGDLQYRNIVYDFVGLGTVNEEVVPLDQRAVFHFWNPKAGFSFDINPSNNVYVFAGISNREPVRDDFTESSADSRPKHETLQNLEIGYRFNQPKVRAVANAYLMNYKNQLVLTGEINDVGAYTRTNIDRSYRAGIELEAAWQPLSWAALEGNVSFSNNKIASFTEFIDLYNEDWDWVGVAEVTYEGTDIAFSPRVVSAARMVINPVTNATIALHGKYVSDQFIDNSMSQARKLDAYLVNDLRLSYKVKNKLISEMEFTLAVNNIFDVDYITNAWIYKGVVGNSGLTAIEDGYFPQAGRYFLAGIRFNL